MAELDTFTLDRDIRRLATSLRAWFRALRSDPERAAGEDPFGALRYASTRPTFEALKSASVPDPMRVPLQRWVYRLALTRIAGPYVVDLEKARAREAIEVERPEPGVYSARSLLARALADPVPLRRRGLLQALATGAPAISRAEDRLDQALVEISARLGVERGDALTLPVPVDALEGAARDLLSRTKDLQHALMDGATDLADVLERTLGRATPGAWPAHFSARWLSDLFRDTALLHGLSLDLGPLPRPIGAASVLRGLARLGASQARAGASASDPFCLAHDATCVQPLRRGALFGALLMDAVFLRHRLDLSRDRARDAAREMGRTVLAHLRLQAAAFDMGGARISVVDRADRLSDAVGAPLAPALACVVPRRARRAGANLLAAFLAAADREMLVAMYDEDWFRNPRGVEWLRSQDAMPPPATIAAADLARAFTSLVGWLEGVVV